MSLRFWSLIMVVLLGFSSAAFAGGKKDYHCEVKKDGKHVDLPKSEATDRKTCKSKGGKWVKDHDHSHDGDHDHEHDEE